MSAFEEPKQETNAHYGDKRRLVAIAFPESYDALIAAVKNRWVQGPVVNCDKCSIYYYL